MDYLESLPDELNRVDGISKVFVVRQEIIHLKHIFTEIFVRKNIDINTYLNRIEYSMFDYMEIMTNRMRYIHNIDRFFNQDVEKILKSNRKKFFPTVDLYKDLNNVIVLDFDGVITSKKFRKLYDLCIKRSKVIVCSANPSITEDWFINRNLSLPDSICSLKGKVKKIKKLIEIQKYYDFVFYVDDEIEYLEYAWLFGIHTFRYDNKEIKSFSLNSK